jgi:protein-tyrosine-phosphatase
MPGVVHTQRTTKDGKMPENEPLTHETGAAAAGNLEQQRPDPDPRYHILFLCRDNSALSIIAQALLNRSERSGFRAFSAARHPALEVHPLAAQLLKTNGIWSEALRPKDCARFLGQDAPPVNFVISLGTQAPDGMPSSWPGNPRVMHWRISEPRDEGNRKENLSAFRKAFTELETRIKLFVLVHERKARKKIAASRQLSGLRSLPTECLRPAPTSDGEGRGVPVMSRGARGESLKRPPDPSNPLEEDQRVVA